MAKYKKTKRDFLSNINEDKTDNIEPSNEDSIFDDVNQMEETNKQENTENNSSDVLKEIEEVLSEGSYREKTQTLVLQDKDEGTDAEVFNEHYKKEEIKEKKIKKAQKPKKPYEKTTWVHKMKVLGILLVLGIFTGSGLGVWYFNYELRSTFDPNAFNASDYTQSVSDTFKKNNINATTSDKTSWVDKAKVQGLTPADLTPADNFILAEYNVTLASSYEISGVGYVDSTGVRQSIISRKKFNGKYYTFESISPSKISFIDDIILCDKYIKGGNEIVVYKSSKTNPAKGDWKQAETQSTQSYIDTSGGLPSSIQPYIISEKTVISSTNDKNNIVYNEEDGTYSFTMSLDKQTSVINYSKQVKRTGGLGSYPEFEKITFSVVIDSDWNLISFGVKENYSAVKGIRAKCSGTLNYTVTLNGEVDMPV